MNKIPVLATVSRAYGFLLGEIGTIVRLAWAPLAIAAAISYFYGGAAVDASIEAAKDPARAMQYMGVNLLIGCVAFVAAVIALVALLQVVIFGDRKPGLFVYLWLGGAELRLIMVYILLVVAFIAAMIGAVLVISLLAVLAAAVPAMAVVLVIGVFALMIAFIWALLRLSLIPAVVVAERTLGVERSWELTKGNALRMLGVFLLTWLPYMIAASLVAFALIGSDFPALPPFPSVGEGGDVKAASEAFSKAMEQWQVDLLKGMRAHWVEFSIAGFVGNLISSALTAGVIGSAYNAVAGERK